MYSYGSNLSPERETREAKFGNNYSQRARVGLNGTRQKWRIQWERITEAEAESLRDFFEDLEGVFHFTWTPIGQSNELRWLERGYSMSHNDFNQWSFSVNIEQVFDNT